jgi:hypothetical protein
MSSNCNRDTADHPLRFDPPRNAWLHSVAVASMIWASVVLTACSTSNAGSAGVTPSPTGIEAADTAYYFGSDRKLVAVEALKPPARTINESAMVGTQDAADWIFASTCQASLPDYVDETEMVGKAVFAAYTISQPDRLEVLAVEDLQGVASRKINPLTQVDDGGVCCCALKKCGPVKCCPCKTNC